MQTVKIMQKYILNNCGCKKSFYIMETWKKIQCRYCLKKKVFHTLLLPLEEIQQTVLTNPVSQIIKLQAVTKNY